MVSNGSVASFMLICFLRSVYSNSIDVNYLLIHKYNCTPGDYYDPVDGCVRCTTCEKENFITETPCSLHSDAICKHCKDGHEKQLQGESIRCIQSSNKSGSMAHHGDGDDLDLDLSPNQSSYNRTVSQTLPEHTNDVSTSDDVKAPILSNEIIFIVKVGLGKCIAL